MTWRTVAIAIVCVLGIAACSPDDGPESGSSSSVTPSVEATDGTSVDPAPAATVSPSTPSSSTTTSHLPPASSTTPSATPTAPPTDVPPITTDGTDAGGEPVVLGPMGSTEVEFDTGAGTVQIGSGEVPDLVPETFPLPSDLAVQTASATDDSAGFTGVSQLGFAALVQLYLDGLAAAGYVVTEDTFVDGSIAVMRYEGSDGSGEVVISAPAPGGGQSVIVTFER